MNNRGIHDLLAFNISALHEFSLKPRFSALNSNVSHVSSTRQVGDKQLSSKILLFAAKNAEKARHFRKEGNVFYMKGNFYNALLRYSESVSYAPPGNEALGMAFANRSAVFMHLKMYDECLQDITYALENNYPEVLHYKLVNRRENVQKDIFNNIFNAGFDLRYGKPPPLNFKQNSSIKCAGDCIEIKANEEWGTYVVATKNISIGDVIASENPFCKILNVEKYKTHCYECMEPCLNMIACDKCTLVMFCGKACKSTCLTSYHVFECPILSMIISTNSLECILALKICLTTPQDFAEKDFVNDPLKQSYYKFKTFSDKFRFAIDREKKSKIIFNASIVATDLFELVLKSTSFFHEAWNSDQQNQNSFKELLLHNLLMILNNFSSIAESVVKGNKACKEIKGLGTYPFIKTLNHSCYPNVDYSFYGNTAVLRALRPIKKGEQLFICYEMPYFVIPKPIRQTHMRDFFYFQCKCEACTDDWPLYEFSPLKCVDIGDNEAIIMKLHMGCRETASKFMDNLRKLGHLFDQPISIPFQELLTVQMMIAGCADVMGSRKDFSMYLN